MGIVKFPTKDRTAAERMRRMRANRKAKSATVTVQPTVTPTVTRTVTAVTAVTESPVTVRNWCSVTVVTGVTLAALSLAGISAFMSVTGLVTVFAGADRAVTLLGAGFEAGKLAAVTVAHRNSDPWLRLALVVAVVVLMGFNTVGVFGFLSAAHLSDSNSRKADINRDAAEIAGKIEVQQYIIKDYDAQIAQLDAAVQKDIDRGLTTKALGQRTATMAQRLSLTQKRDEAVKARAALETSQATVASRQDGLPAHLAQVKYLADLFHLPEDTTLHWFILVAAFVLDPLAVLLWVAVNRLLR